MIKHLQQFHRLTNLKKSLKANEFDHLLTWLVYYSFSWCKAYYSLCCLQIIYYWPKLQKCSFILHHQWIHLNRKHHLVNLRHKLSYIHSILIGYSCILYQSCSPYRHRGQMTNICLHLSHQTLNIMVLESVVYIDTSVNILLF